MLIGAKDELQTDIESKKVAIENSKEEEVLGITFDNKLEFYSYLTSINKKANIKLNNLTRVQKYMAPEQKTVLTFSFIKSQFNYCPLTWVFCSEKGLHRLNNKHERSLRFIHSDYISNFIVLSVNANEKSIQKNV